MIDGPTLIAATSVAVSILVPVGAFFVHQDRRLTKIEAMVQMLIDQRAPAKAGTPWRTTLKIADNR